MSSKISSFYDFIESQGYFISSIEGQRILCPIDPIFEDRKFHNVKQHEVFISHLPNNLLEDELLPFLCNAGPVYQIRMIMNISGCTKGQAFVIFSEVRDAYKAVEALNNKLIRPDGRPLKVVFSANNKRLLLENIPKYYSPSQIYHALSQRLMGVTKVKIVSPLSKDFHKNTNNAIVTFESHKFAASARRLFLAELIDLNGLHLNSKWAKPKDFQTLLFVFQSPEKILSEKELRNLLEIPKLTKINNIVYKYNLAFIKFQSFQMANYVYKLYSNPILKYPINSGQAVIQKIDWPNRT